MADKDKFTNNRGTEVSKGEDKYAESRDLSSKEQEEILKRQNLQQSLEAAAIKTELYSDLPPETAQFFISGLEKLEQDRKNLVSQLTVSTQDIIAQQIANRNIQNNLRYVELTFLPLKDFPNVNIVQLNGGNLMNPTLVQPPVTTLIPWANAPVVEIFAHTPNAPEFALVDELVLVEDLTGDGYGFEEVSGVYSTSTSTFNVEYSAPGTKIGVRLDRRMFQDNCYSSERKYVLTFASGHVEIINALPPSPCWQSGTDSANVNYLDTGWIQRYCTGQDYMARRWARKNWPNGSTQKCDFLIQSQTLTSGGRFDSSPNSNPVLISPNMNYIGWSMDTAPNGTFATKGDAAETIALMNGQNITTTVSAASTEFGAPLHLMAPHKSRTDFVMLPGKQQLHLDGYTGPGLDPNLVGNFNWVYNGNLLMNSLESHIGSGVSTPTGFPMRPDEGSYGMVRNYTYSENLPDCLSPAPTDIEVCIDNTSPSFYQTTNEDCNGTDITAYLNGSSGAYNLIDGQCCAVDCSNFNMLITSTDSTYGANNGTITVDFTNNTGVPIGNPDTTANEHSYDIELVTSNGTAITQNSNAAYASGAYFQDATCDTAAGSSIVTCNSNTSITIGMSVTGTGVTGTAYVGAITDGEPGAVTEFQLSSSPSSNVPVNSSGAQTNTTLTFAIDQYRFQWGSLAPYATAGNYTVTVTDDDGCIFTQTLIIREDDPIYDCIDSTAINYDAAANLACTPDCCLFCDHNSGDLVNSSNAVIGSFLTAANATATHDTGPTVGAGAITLTGSINNMANTYLTATMSYKYTLQALTSSGNLAGGMTNVFDSNGSIVSSTTSTLATGIVTSFSDLYYGYYAIKIEIEDSSTGADAGLEKCFQWVVVDVKANVCTDPLALNYPSGVPANLQISQNGLCTYPVGCDCTILNITQQAVGCSFDLTAEIDCDPTSAVTWDWSLNGTSLYSGTSASVSLGSFPLPSQYVLASGTYDFTLTDNGAAGNCISSLSTVVNLPVCGCTDATALNYDPFATLDDGSCIYCVYGCTDPSATNYNSLATCDDGSCTYPIGGCTDPTANNYDPAATIDDGSCEWSGCLDQTALNYLHDCSGTYNPNINLADISCCTFCSPPTFNNIVITNASASSTTCAHNSDGSASLTNTNPIGVCTTWDWSVYDVSGTLVYSTPTPVAFLGTASTGNILAVGPYTWTATDCNGCTEVGTFTIGTAPSNCGCTDPDADNYDPTATIDDGSCLYLGCTDPNAANYNPNAIQDDGTCTYTIAPNPCSLSPRVKRKIDGKMFGCLTLKGSMYLNKLRIGYTDDCSIADQWKLILVNYLLQRKDLDCMFNCSDDMTTAPTATANSCEDLLAVGGPTTGLNDASHPGSTYTVGTGTVITDPSLFFVASVQLFQNDVIQMPSGNIYIMVGGFNCTYGCYNPETSQGATSGHWQQCTSLSTFNNTYTTNYIDPFIRFMNDQCDKCTEDVDCIQGRFKGTTPY